MVPAPPPTESVKVAKAPVKPVRSVFPNARKTFLQPLTKLPGPLGVTLSVSGAHGRESSRTNNAGGSRSVYNEALMSKTGIRPILTHSVVGLAT